jgi:hypothetical protein
MLVKIKLPDYSLYYCYFSWLNATLRLLIAHSSSIHIHVYMPLLDWPAGRGCIGLLGLHCLLDHVQAGHCLLDHVQAVTLLAVGVVRRDATGGAATEGQIATRADTLGTAAPLTDSRQTQYSRLKIQITSKHHQHHQQQH